MTEKTVTIKPPLKEILFGMTLIIDNPEMRKRVFLRSTLELKDRAATYPPEGRWNRQPGINKQWYQRLFGPRWLNEDGSMGGENTSQRLQHSWKTEVQRADEFTASAFTEVTYAPDLMDTSKRASWAAGHGWKTIDEIADGYTQRFVDVILEEIDKGINEL